MNALPAGTEKPSRPVGVQAVLDAVKHPDSVRIPLRIHYAARCENVNIGSEMLIKTSFVARYSFPSKGTAGVEANDTGVQTGFPRQLYLAGLVLVVDGIPIFSLPFFAIASPPFFPVGSESLHPLFIFDLTVSPTFDKP
ncbi:hypothetical protein MSAN_02050700 [Mycena sanguinolenta]|uniref:Uncharacterized protein n=1 Tax=Mycena sanguinolenta TaxID=230812 RepID=A0A8H6XK42_9AGAR|nr:hypothetical protein MSAN_02050700 [Mycena sanguinolenta]